MVLNLLCPPRSQSFIVTFPLVTLRMLKPTWFYASRIVSHQQWFSRKIQENIKPNKIIRPADDTHGGNHVFTVSTRLEKRKNQIWNHLWEIKWMGNARFSHSDCIDKRCLSGVLKPNKRKFHFLFEKQTEQYMQSDLWTDNLKEIDGPFFIDA